MNLFHTHEWKEIARTYAEPVGMSFEIRGYTDFTKLTMGCTTILWECKDRECRQLRKEEMLGKTVK